MLGMYFDSLAGIDSIVILLTLVLMLGLAWWTGQTAATHRKSRSRPALRPADQLKAIVQRIVPPRRRVLIRARANRAPPGLQRMTHHAEPRARFDQRSR